MTEIARFIDSAEMRATDLQILQALLYLADGDEAQAERIWRAPTNMELVDIYVLLTGRGSYRPVYDHLLARARSSQSFRRRVAEAARRVLAFKGTLTP